MSRALETPESVFRDRAVKLIASCETRGVIMRPFFTVRTPEEQARLWRSSRSREQIETQIQKLRQNDAPYLADVLERVGPQSAKGETTNSLPGQSWHQWGEAIDCFWLKDGVAEWGDQEGYRIYAEEAVKLGLTAGFNWPRFKDSVHVQLRPEPSPLAAGLSWRQVNDRMQQWYS